MTVREKVYKLVFDEDHELHGFTVRIGTVNIGDLFDLIELRHNQVPERFADEVDGKGKVTRYAAVAAFDWSIDLMGAALKSWDVQLPAVPPARKLRDVPATAEGLRMLDREMILLLREAWCDAVRTVSRPLPKPSSSGPPSVPELPTAMVPLSDSRAS